jgi:diguanylate cyclase (GGDEF)-like protein
MTERRRSGQSPGDEPAFRSLARELGVPAERLASLAPDLAQLISARLASLQEAAHVDDLTGTLRRGAGLAALEREIGRARRHGDHLFAVAFIDLEALKSVNDSSGHAAGDALLRELAGALKRRLRAYDLVMRWGGDEFVVALSHAGERSARRILQEIEDDFRNRTGHNFDVGVAEIGPEGGSEELVARADADLYARRRERERWGESRQKRQGRSLHSPA